MSPLGLLVFWPFPLLYFNFNSLVEYIKVQFKKKKKKKTLKIDATLVIKMDMSYFEFPFSFKKNLKTQIWIKNLAAGVIREEFSGLGWVEEQYGLGLQELELQGEKTAFSSLGYRIEVQTFYYRERNLSILHVWTPLTK